MIPFLFMRGSAAGPFVAYINTPGTYNTSMGVGDSALIAIGYYNIGVFVNRANFYVRVGGVTTLWNFALPGTVDQFTTGANYSASSSGWVGAETYEFWFEARRASTGVFDIISNTVTLIVS
jgi:hypothetical protein